MAKNVRRMRTWAAGAAVLVLALGAVIGVIVTSGDPDTPTAPLTSTPQATATATPSEPGDEPTIEPDTRVALGCAPGESGLVFSGSSAVDTFDGAPATPQPFCDTNWDIAVSSRDPETYLALEPMLAKHGHDCSPPPDEHQHDGNYEQAVFSCRDHIMTAINASDYGVVYLTPAALVDFSGGEAVISFDMSTFRSSGRDWADLWITPWEDNLQLPLDDYFPDLQGEPRRAIHVKMDGPLGDTQFKVYVVDEFSQQELPLNWGPLEQALTPDESRRDTFELRISRTHVSFGLPEYGRWWVDAAIPDLGWDSGVVQFGHHSYNPTKDGVNQLPGTWHWDNVSIAPATPFTITRGDFRYADAEGQAITFAEPAVAGAHLRFSAVGTIELSFDGGATWSPAERQAEEGRHPEHFSSYWTPVPEGTSSVMVRGGPDDWFEQWFAKDFALWSKP